MLTSSPIASSALVRAPSVAERGHGALGQRVRVVDADSGKAPAQRARRAAVFPGDDDRALGGAETVPHRAVETAAELGDIAITCLVAERDAQRVVVVIGLLGRGQHVGQRFADVVHVGGPVPAQIGKQPRCRERRGDHGRAGAHRHAPAGEQRVGVKQRHRQIADVGGVDLEPLDQRHAGKQHDQVGDLHRLRLAAGPRGEDHHEGVGGRDLAIWGQRSGIGEQRRPRLARHVEHLHTGQVETVQQLFVGRVGEQDLAVGTQDVPGQRVAAAGVVDSAQHIAAERRRRHGGEHLGGVAQQRADVQRPVRIGDANQRGGGGGRIGQVFTPGPDPVAVLDAGVSWSNRSRSSC